MVFSIVSSQNKISKILLVISLVSAGLNIGSYFQTEYQLLSPLIPKSIILDISRPHLFAALISIIGSIISLICYFYSKFLFTIIICGIILG